MITLTKCYFFNTGMYLDKFWKYGFLGGGGGGFCRGTNLVGVHQITHHLFTKFV